MTTPLGYHPTGKILGWICWYTIESAWVAPDDLAKWWDELSLDQRYLRTELSKTEAFRRAFSPNEHRYRWTVEEGVEATLRCETIKLDSKATRHKVVRRIVRSQTNARKADINFQTEMAEAAFYKDPGEMKTRRFTNEPGVAEHVQQYLDELTERYNRRATHLDSDKVRSILRSYIEGLNAIMVRRGVYFVHDSRHSTLIQLQDLVGRCSARSSLHMIPLPDVPEQREMVMEAFNTEIVGRANSLLEDITDLLAGNSRLTSEKFDTTMETFGDIRTRIGEYKTALGESQGRAEAALELVEDQLLELQLRQAKEEKKA